MRPKTLLNFWGYYVAVVVTFSQLCKTQRQAWLGLGLNSSLGILAHSPGLCCISPTPLVITPLHVEALAPALTISSPAWSQSIHGTSIFFQEEVSKVGLIKWRVGSSFVHSLLNVINYHFSDWFGARIDHDILLWWPLVLNDGTTLLTPPPPTGSAHVSYQCHMSQKNVQNSFRNSRRTLLKTSISSNSEIDALVTILGEP